MREAISEPAALTPEAAVMSPRREYEKSLTGVCVVLDDVVCTPQTPLVMRVSDGRE